jgi:WD40 repeat protein
VAWGKDDRNYFAAGTQDGSIGLWEVVSSSWSSLNFQRQADTGVISALDWNPNQPQLLTLSVNEGLQVWNADTGGRLMQMDYKSRSAAWSPDGMYIALEDHALYPGGASLLVVIQSGAVKAQAELPSEANQVAWSPDGRMIATAGVDGVLRLWRGIDENSAIGTLEQLSEFPQDAEITTMTWSPQGDRVITGDINGSIWMWDVP